jgi:hypothetical protein
MIAYPTRALLDAVDDETPRTGAVWLIERAASFYRGAEIALEEILGPGPLDREALAIAAALTRLGERAADLETAAAEALARVKP